MSVEYLSELQNALLWINYRYYLAPLFLVCRGGAWGPLTLIACLQRTAPPGRHGWRADQTPHHRLQSGIDGIPHIVDWLPVRLVGVVYALVGHGEKRSRRGLLRWATAIRRSIRC